MAGILRLGALKSPEQPWFTNGASLLRPHWSLLPTPGVAQHQIALRAKYHTVQSHTYELAPGWTLQSRAGTEERDGRSWHEGALAIRTVSELPPNQVTRRGVSNVS
jgi:hypothetical protein